MTTSSPVPSGWRDWMTMLGVAVAVIATTFSAVQTYGGNVTTLRLLDERVKALELDAQRRADLLTAIDVRTARIETKLEMMTTARGERPGAGPH